MGRKPFAIPFGVGLLGLLGIILLPLVGALLAIGWYATAQLEEAVLAARTRALESTISTLAEQGFQSYAHTHQAFADSGIFADHDTLLTKPEALGRAALRNMLGRHPNMVAGYVGFADGSFFYVARVERMAQTRREEIGAPAEARIAVRVIRIDGTARHDAWSFLDAAGAPLGGETASRQAYDPRTRTWFADAVRTGRTIITEPYTFAGAGGIGLTIATPLAGSTVIGADLTLASVSRLVSTYKVTPSSLVVVATEGGGIVARTDLESPDATPRALMGWIQDDVRRLAGGDSRSVVTTRSLEGTEIRVQSRALPPVLGRQLYLAIAAPVSELTAETGGLIRRSALVAAAAVLLALAAGMLAARLMSGPLARIANKTDRIRRLDFSDASRIDSRIREIGRLDLAVEQMRSGLEQFGRYVPRQLVRQVIESPTGAAIGGTRQPVTVLITDIAGFSQTAETMEPEQLVARLSRYLESLGGIVMAHGGTIDKYIGDSIMALWNAPSSDPGHVAGACRAAMAMALASEHLETKWVARGRLPFRTRCGLHTGAAIVGNIGSLDRMNYTVVGTVPNVASRIEALNKVYGTRVLASGAVFDAVPEALLWRTIDSVVPAGMTVALDLHEPMAARTADDGGSQAALAAFLDRWHAALAAYRQGNIETAHDGFRALLAEHPEDGPCLTFVARCRDFLDNGLPRGWTGVTAFHEK